MSPPVYRLYSQGRIFNWSKFSRTLKLSFSKDALKLTLLLSWKENQLKLSSGLRGSTNQNIPLKTYLYCHKVVLRALGIYLEELIKN